MIRLRHREYPNLSLPNMLLFPFSIGTREHVPKGDYSPEWSGSVFSATTWLSDQAARFFAAFSHSGGGVLPSDIRAIGLARHVETEMLSPLLYIALVAHAHFLCDMDGGAILRRDQRDYTRKTQLLQAIVFQRLHPLYGQPMLPVGPGEHIAQLYLLLLLYLLVQQSTLPDKPPIALENGSEERVAINLVFPDIAVQHALHLVPTAWSPQKTHHFWIGVENRQAVQVVKREWPKHQMLRL